MVNPRIYSAPAMLPEIHRAPTCAVPQWQLRSKLPPEASDHCAGQRLPWKKMVGSPTTIGLCRDVMGIYWDIMEYNNSWDVPYIGELKIAMENGPFIDKSSIKNYWSSSHVSLLESTNTHTHKYQQSGDLPSGNQTWKLEAQGGRKLGRELGMKTQRCCGGNMPTVSPGGLSHRQNVQNGTGLVNCEVSRDWRFQPPLLKQEGLQLAEASFRDMAEKNST